ncbi:MAG: F0F1 ATP synthase subunit epsilon [Brevundimonas sp.]
MAELEVDLVATDGKVWTGSARQLIAPAGDGEIGILAGHTPVLTILRPGEIRVYPADGGAIERWQVDGGFLSYDDNRATIVVDAVSKSAPAPAAH